LIDKIYTEADKNMNIPPEVTYETYDGMFWAHYKAPKPLHFRAKKSNLLKNFEFDPQKFDPQLLKRLCTLGRFSFDDK
jgi:hypothetical protein